MTGRWTLSTAAITAAMLAAGAMRHAEAQETPPEGAREKMLRVVRTPTPPVIDGVLDDEVWQLAVPIDDFHEIQPTEYAPPSERTVVYVLYDSDALYIAARLYDREPGEITARILRQGERVFGDDWFTVMIDPFHDRRSGYRFQTNPNGLRQEALYQNVSDEQWDWQGIWETASSIDGEGWVTEIAIPFKTISFDPNGDTWGINFRRAIARRDERIGWVSRNRNTDPSTSGIAVGFEGLDQGLGLDIVPSMSVSQRHDFDPGAHRTGTDPSFDLFYKLTPSLTTALTVNTDFSATEVDDRQVNLTRFSLFFPEKRDFFLQDADIFEFGNLDQNGRPFFSRSIGLTPEGERVDLDVGGKLTGRIGRFNIGVLSVRQDGAPGTATSPALPADNATVLRASANLFEESNIGVIVTEGDPGVALDNSLTGIDFLYRNSRLPGGKLIEVNAWAQESDTEGETRDQKAYGFRVSTPNNSRWRGDLRFTHLGEGFNPGLGFVNRVGIRQLNFGTQYTHRPREGLFRSVLSGYNAERVELVDGELQSQNVRYRLTELENRLGDKLALEHKAQQEQLFTDFDVSSEVASIPVGHYSFQDTSLTLETADQRKVWGTLTLLRGGFFDGDRARIAATVNWRPSGRLRTSFGYDWNDIELPERAAAPDIPTGFTTRLVNFAADVAFSSRLSWVTRIQYDNVSNLMGVNLRLHWIPEAGREGFVVLNHDLVDVDDRFRSYAQEAAVKFGYTFRF